MLTSLPISCCCVCSIADQRRHCCLSKQALLREVVTGAMFTLSSSSCPEDLILPACRHCCRFLLMPSPRPEQAFSSFPGRQPVWESDDGGRMATSWVSVWLLVESILHLTAKSENSIPASAREKIYNLSPSMLSTSPSTGWLKICSLNHSWSQWNSPLCAAVACQTVSLCQLGGHSAWWTWQSWW